MKYAGAIGACLLLIGIVLPVSAEQSDDRLRAALRARMALLHLHTAMSSDRTIAVLGPRPSSNAFLLEAVQVQRTAMERFLRLPMPFNGQRLRLHVLPPPLDGQAEEQEVLLRTELVLGEVAHRIVLPDYASAMSVTAQEALVYALLSVYTVDAGNLRHVPVLPPWFWQGVGHVLHPDDVKITLDYVDALWRAGQVPSLSQFLRASSENRLEPDAAMFGGAIVLWLASRPRQERIMPQLLAALAREDTIDAAWLAARLGGDPDEMLDRWLLTQRRIVRGVGTVLQSHVDQLQEAILLYPGQHGIPRHAAVNWGAPLRELGLYRDRVWFEEALQQRRNSLELVTQGRPDKFREIVDEFIAVLDGIADGADMLVLEEQEQLAHLALQLFKLELTESGGIWRADD